MRMKKEKRQDDKLTKVFGLIARSSATSALVLSHSLISVAEVMPSVSEGVSEQEYFIRHPGIRPEEIKALKAYHARFGPDVDTPLSLPEGPKSLLLDENVPYTLIPLVNKHFGFSSHVEAEGFSRQNRTSHQRGPVAALDGLIARFAAENSFGGIVTYDTDFENLYRYAAHPVRNINVFLMDKNNRELTAEQRLIRYQDTIRRQLASPTRELVKL